MYKFIRFILFLFDPEKIHNISFFVISKLYKLKFFRIFCRKSYIVSHQSLEKSLFGINFPNPVGLAAGFDKDAKLIDPLSLFGFGFIEIGTLTPKSQQGNEKPRLFRIKRDSSIINRMGFNNNGVKDAIERLKKVNSNIIIGGNIGKNKDTKNIDAVDDYIFCFNELFNYVDYFVVNVSSPNTPDLRQLQESKPLKLLLNSIQKINNKKDRRKPILLKISPDLNNNQLDDIIKIVLEIKIDGIIATNTTIDRKGLKTSKNKLKIIGNGGLSGKSLNNRSTEVIRYISEKSFGKIPIIGVGGIHSKDDAIEKINAGASLIQLYTGFIYEGPSLVREINKALIKK